MEKIRNKKMKSHYITPTIVQIGGINTKTLGSHWSQYDSMASSTACMDQRKDIWDSCYMEYHGS